MAFEIQVARPVTFGSDTKNQSINDEALLGGSG
jgi:hypothetical protein